MKITVWVHQKDLIPFITKVDLLEKGMTNDEKIRWSEVKKKKYIQAQIDPNSYLMLRDA